MIKTRTVRFVFLFLVLLSAAFPARASERILSYDVAIRLEKDASAVITEKIKTVVLHSKIRRGIYRELGKKRRMSYEVLDVLRNGKKEAFFVENDGGIFRINTGGDDLIPTGETTFEITYRATNILRSFKDFDELYWNVTGNKWAFPIDRATARIAVPDGARITERKIYEGRTGSTRRGDFRNGVFLSTVPLSPGEGLTIAVGFEKGFFDMPEPLIRPETLLKAAYAVLFAYLLATWFLYGRDPEKGAVMPRYDVLRKITPAFEGYVAKYGNDPERLAAVALLQGCVSKFLKITEKDKKTFVVEKLRPPENSEEKVIAKTFSFPQKISETDRLKMRDLKDRLIASFAVRSSSYFEENNLCLFLAYCVFGGFLAFLFLSAVSELPDFDSEMKFAGLLFALLFSYLASNQIQQRICAKRMTWQLPFSLLVTFLQSCAFWFVCPSPVIVYALTGTIALAVYGYLIKRPLRKGTKVLEHLDGIKMFLDAVNLYPETFDDMEKLLPFAVLLGMEKQYNKKTKALIERFHTAPQWFYDMPRYSRFATSYTGYAAPVAKGGSGLGGGFAGGGCGGHGGGGR